MSLFDRWFSNADIHPPNKKTNGRSRREFFGAVSGVAAGTALVAVAPKTAITPASAPVPVQKAIVPTIEHNWGMSSSCCYTGMALVTFYRTVPRGEDS